MSPSTEDGVRFEAAIAAVDAANSGDPNTVSFEGRERPKEVVYAIQMSRWLDRIAPDASPALRLAARCQHIRRFEIPRETYPMGRIGYLKWRTDLKHLHARIAGEILARVGYDAGTIARVQALVRKDRLKQDPEAQTLEDVVCLVFLENYFADFAVRHDDDKIVDIVRKTWVKMSETGHQAALSLPLPAAARRLVERALAGASPPGKA
ncbi:MAG: DUF4202 domain-containing protein [Alphaproteobacteria bacterium]